jgi:hypothetical protein
MKKSLEFIDELIKLEEQRDIEYRKQQIALNKASNALGKSIFLFYLEELKKLVIEESIEKGHGD